MKNWLLPHAINSLFSNSITKSRSRLHFYAEAETVRKNSKSRPRVLLDLFLFPGFSYFRFTVLWWNFNYCAELEHAWKLIQALMLLKGFGIFYAFNALLGFQNSRQHTSLLVNMASFHWLARAHGKIYVDLLKQDAQGGICINQAHYCYLPRLIDPAPSCSCMVADLSSFHSLHRCSTSIKISSLRDPNPKLFGFHRLLLR